MPEDKIRFQSEIKELQEDSAGQIKAIKDLVTLLVKTLKICCIYPSDNPIPNEFKNNLFKRLFDFLGENEELKIRVEQSKLYSEDKLILQEEKEDEGVSFALYRDGIREIAFQRGIEPEELYTFLEIVSRCLKSFLPEDDIVTLLWEKELTHIKFLVVDEFLSEDLLDLPQPVGAKDFKNLHYSEVELKDEEEERKGISTKIEIERLLRDLDLTPEKELKELKTLLEKDKDFEPLKEIFSILREMILGEKEFPDFAETVNISEKLLDSLVSHGDFYLASEVLLLLKDMEKVKSDADQSNRSERFKEAINRAGDRERMKVLTQVLNQNSKSDLFSARKYLTLLNWNAVPHLVDMLGEMESFPARKMVCSVLENVGEKNIDLLGKGIYDRRWYVVRNLVSVLGRIGSYRAIPYLKKTIAHEDIRVRKETLEALSRIEGGEVTDTLLKALEDSDERLRIKAAELLSQRPGQEAFLHLSELLSRKNFKDKSKVEKEAFLKSWAQIGKDESILLLKKLILKRAVLKREKHKETSALALKALASLKTPLSQDTLKELCSKGSRRVQKQAKALWEKTSLQE
jgi:hypothetical protein